MSPGNGTPVRKPKTVFLLGNGRSGTRYLCGLFRTNAANCVAMHEPYWQAARPSMFGLPIYYATHGKTEELRRFFDRKVRGILSYGREWYVETNHAFLKSFADLAVETFPDMKLVHVVRNPLHACASQAHRERFIHRWRIPFRAYRADNGRLYYRWRLTGDEPIYQHFGPGELTLFQDFFVQWIEIENRAQRFLDRYGKRGDCFFLHTPGELHDRQKIAAMFEFLGMGLIHGEVVLSGTQNRTPGRSGYSADNHLLPELKAVIERLPDSYLEIFSRPPYRDLPWVNLLHKHAAPRQQVQNVN